MNLEITLHANINLDHQNVCLSATTCLTSYDWGNHYHCAIIHAPTCAIHATSCQCTQYQPPTTIQLVISQPWFNYLQAQPSSYVVTNTYQLQGGISQIPPLSNAQSNIPHPNHSGTTTFMVVLIKFTHLKTHSINNNIPLNNKMFPLTCIYPSINKIRLAINNNHLSSNTYPFIKTWKATNICHRNQITFIYIKSTTPSLDLSLANIEWEEMMAFLKTLQDNNSASF